MFLISLANFRTHRNLRGILDIFLDILRQNGAQIRVNHLFSHADMLDQLRVDQIIGDNLGKLREMPAVPLLQSHCIVVDLFVKIVQKGNGLDDHDVHFLGGEFKLIAG